MSSRSTSRRFAPAETISWTDAGGGLVLFDRVRDTYHELNGPASAIWRALQAGRSETALIDLLARHFDADREMLAADVADFLASAQARGLIVEIP